MKAPAKFWLVAVLVAASMVVARSQSASTNRLLLTVQQLDSSSSPVVNRQIGYVSYAGNVGALTIANLSSGANALTLPVSPVLQLYVRNNHATNTVTVIATPQGGVSATLAVLGPGAALLVWEATTAATYGYTAITLTASGANTPVEMFLGG